MDLLEVERQRLLLEDNLTKLKASLKHFQTLTAEYEGLTEEIQAGGEDVDLENVSKTYAGDIVNEKEVRDLAGLPKSPRSNHLVLDLIAKRQEYVQKNIETLQRQFWDAEAKLEELDFASANRDHERETLPLTEIHEELDDDDNVVSSSVVQPEAATSKLVESLRKAGLTDKDLDSTTADVDETVDEPSDDYNTKPGAPSLPPSALVTRTSYGEASPRRPSQSEDEISSSRPAIRKKSVSFTADTKPPPAPDRPEQEDGKRCVSFNDKVAVMPAAPPPDPRSVSFAPQVQEIPAEPAKVDILTAGAAGAGSSSTNSKDDMQKKLREFMFKPGERVGQIDSNDELTQTHFVMPENESEEEAAIRREMLEYHLNEVGHVVAQMDLDEDEYDLDEDDIGSTSEPPSSEYPEEDTPYTSGFSDSDRESEDEFGRSTRKVISDDYHKEMQRLQQRLIGNLGPSPAIEDGADETNLDADHVHRLVVQDSSVSKAASDTVGNSDRNVKKRVSFAETPLFEQEQNVAQKAASMLRAENETPLADMIMERASEAGGSSSTSTITKPATKPSRFKSSQKSGGVASSSGTKATPLDLSTPQGPPGQIISNELVERPSRAQEAIAPSADGSDPTLQRRELAEEYYRRRNDMIRQQGGFKADMNEDDDAEEEGELMEERDGKLKKVSRFRAARIKGGGI